MAVSVLPALSATLNVIELLPESVAVSHVIAVPDTLFVMSTHVAPLSTDPNKISFASSAPLNVPVTVCAAVFVMKSERLVPVSALMPTPLTVCTGAVVSNT